MFYRKMDCLENFREGQQSEKVYSNIESIASVLFSCFQFKFLKSITRNQVPSANKLNVISTIILCRASLKNVM